MKKQFLVLLTVVSVFFCFINSSEARNPVYTAKISNILFYEGGDLIYVYLEGGTQSKPACAGGNGDYLSFSMKRPRAKEYLAGLMMAFSTGKSVTFTTYGACVDQSVSDTIVYFSVNNS